MLTRLALAVTLASLPLSSLAQGAPSAKVCDGSDVRRAERLRNVGGSLFVGTAAFDLAALLTVPHNPDGVTTARSRFRLVFATAPIALVGALIADRAHPGEGFWERAIARLKVGETRSADVSLCLHRPEIATTRGAEERWTYVVERPAGFRGRLRTVRLTFRDSVLTDVERTEMTRDALAATSRGSTDGHAERHRGICVPAPAVFADPFPTPTDTTAAAAAMARAQADADAAMKNAENAAAFAACMASDSAMRE